MAISLFALAAAVAAQASVPQASVQASASASQPATEAEARVQGIAEGQEALAQSGAATPSQASVPNAFHGKLLWRNIEGGMSAAQLHALYPAGSHVTYKDDRTVLSDVAIIDGCNAKVNVMHPSGVVEEIVMRGEGSIAGRCSMKIITALSGKYGEPLDKDKVRGSLFARQGKNYIWTHDGVTLQLKRYTTGALGDGGLFAASWELRYSAAASDIDL